MFFFFYVSSLLPFNIALCLRGQTWSLTAWVPIWKLMCHFGKVMLCNISMPQFPMGIIIVPSMVIMRIKWVIIWKYLKSGNTRYYISVCFYDMTISCLDYWNSLLIDLLLKVWNYSNLFTKMRSTESFLSGSLIMIFFLQLPKIALYFLNVQFKLLNMTFTWAPSTYLTACLSTLYIQVIPTFPFLQNILMALNAMPSNTLFWVNCSLPPLCLAKSYLCFSCYT